MSWPGGGAGGGRAGAAGAQGVPSVAISQSPLAHYVWGATPLVDVSGNGYALTATGTAARRLQSCDGGANQAKLLTGAYVLSRNDAALRLLGAMSVSIMFRIASALTTGDLVTCEGTGGAPTAPANFCYAVGFGATGLNWYQEYGVNLPVLFESQYMPTLSELHVCTCTREADGRTLSMWVDDELVAQTVLSNAPTDGSAALLRWFGNGSGGGQFIGSVYCGSLWDRPLSAAEVRALHALRLGSS